MYTILKHDNVISHYIIYILFVYIFTISNIQRLIKSFTAKMLMGSVYIELV